MNHSSLFRRIRIAALSPIVLLVTATVAHAALTVDGMVQPIGGARGCMSLRLGIPVLTISSSSPCPMEYKKNKAAYSSTRR